MEWWSTTSVPKWALVPAGSPIVQGGLIRMVLHLECMECLQARSKHPKVVRPMIACEARLLGGSGGMPPPIKFLEFCCPEIDSGGFWDIQSSTS